MVIAKDEIVKSEILNKAQGLFKIYGLKKTTMDEIAAACGKAKSTLYHYFKSKEDVFEAVISIELISLRKVVKQEVDREKSIADKILTYFISFHEEVINKMNIYRVVKQEIKVEALGQLYFKRIMKFEEEYIDRLLHDGFDAGEFIDIQKEEISAFSKILIAAFLGIVRYTLESDEGLDKEKLKRAATLIIPRVFS